MIAGGSPSRPRTVQELLSPEFCARLDRMDILSRRIFAGKLHGERRSKQRGQSVEFEDYRNYVAGDDLRHIDWNVFARLDRFFIKVFQHEEDLSCHVVLDASASMEAGTPSKLLAAQRLTMALSYVALVNNNRVSVSIFDRDSLRWVGPLRGRANLQRLGRFLLDNAWASGTSEGRTPAVGVNGFTGAMRAIAQARSGKGVMVVLSDFLIAEGYEEGLRFLAGGGGFDTYCMQILSPGEIDPAQEGVRGDGVPILVGDLSLMDVETGRVAEVTLTADLLKRYRATVAAYIEKLRSFCAARDMAHMLVRSDADIEQLVLEHLRKRGVLR